VSGLARLLWLPEFILEYLYIGYNQRRIIKGPCMKTLDTLRLRRDEIIALARRYGASNVRVFGSVARGESDAQSDVDFLVDMDHGRSLFDMGGLLMELKDLLGKEVDVVTPNGLRARMRERVLNEAVSL
jgi:predicted nucleotidyltransferase